MKQEVSDDILVWIASEGIFSLDRPKLTPSSIDHPNKCSALSMGPRGFEIVTGQFLHTGPDFDSEVVDSNFLGGLLEKNSRKTFCVHGKIERFKQHGRSAEDSSTYIWHLDV